MLPQGLVTSFHEHLNSIDKNIQFTVEKMSSGQMPFLDVLLMREEDGTVSTSVYRKPTHTEQYLAFESHHPMAHKRTLMHRAEALCSSGVSRAQEEKRLQEALEKNGYPATFVQKLRLPQTDRDERQTARTSVTIPYIHGLSQSIRRMLSPLDIRVAFRPFQTLRQELVHTKDPVPELRREWSTPSLVTSAPGVTSGRLDGPWSSALGSITEH